MNPKILLTIAGILVGIGTAVANANHVFEGHVQWMYRCYGVAAVLLCSALFLVFNSSRSPSQRPNLIPIRFGYLTNAPQNLRGQWVKPSGHAFTAQEIVAGKHFVDQGLVFRNDGEPAYHISIPKFSSVGPSKLLFLGRLNRLDKSQGEAVLTAEIARTPHTSITNGLYDEMKDNNVDRVNVTLEYRGDKHGNWWKTICNIERNANVTGGLEVGRFQQRRIGWLSQFFGSRD